MAGELGGRGEGTRRNQEAKGGPGERGEREGKKKGKAEGEAQPKGKIEN